MERRVSCEVCNSSIGGTLVSVFPNIIMKVPANASMQEKSTIYESAVNSPREMSLLEFLKLGEKYREVIERLRSCEDKETRNKIKRTELPCATISASFTSRASSKAVEEKLKRYNSLMVLDFDNLEDPAAAKEELSQLPFFWYIGLSVGGKGLFGIVPLGTDDFKEHKVYFNALRKELEVFGYEVDKACCDVTRLRVVSYDPDAYFNENCEVFCIDEREEDDGEVYSSGPAPERAQDRSSRIELYVLEWEKRHVPLDDYQDWMTVGMALASAGEECREYFHRISVFSSKYSREDTDKKFDGFLQNTRSIKIGSFFYKCHEYGVIPDSVPHYEAVGFPVEVLPKAVQRIVFDTHSFQNFPIDYIAPSLLFVACAACGNSTVVQIINGWCEKPLLYLAIVGDRGTNKTSCFEFALNPVMRKDDEEYDKYVEAKAMYDMEMSKPLKERNARVQEPDFCQTILSDFTPEVLVRQHKANPRGLIVYFDELIGFIYSFNKYRSGSDEQMWTQLFAGSGVTVNRVSSDPVKIDNTCISIFGGVQPGILKSFAKGKVQNGFMDRWIFAFPDKVPYPKLKENEIDDSVKESWNRIIERILSIPYDGKPNVLRFSPEAKAAYSDWFNSLSDQKNCGGDAFAGLATKMDRYCGRLALGLEILAYGCGESELTEVSLRSVKGAIALCYYFIGCGLKAQREYLSSPASDLPAIQRLIYDELPPSFETRQGVEIASGYGMPERSFKRWLATSYFKKVSYGFYEKRFR